MAKSKGFYGLRKGSTKSMTYSILKGQQITKDRVEGGANPKTYSQMTQRMIFGNAVKFYKHAKAGFFRFAFEDKKTKESDYNAFMRHNALKAVAVTYPNYQEDAYPAFGRYTLSQGSLPSPELAWGLENTYVGWQLGAAEGKDTISDLSRRILARYPSLQDGDIVTIVLVHTSLNNQGEMVNEQVNRYDIRQFVIRSSGDDRETADEIGVVMTVDDEVYIKGIEGVDLATNMAKGCAVIFSRNTPSGLKVSTSEIIGNGVAQQFINQMSNEGAIKAAATTWGANNPAILQGALV